MKKNSYLFAASKYFIAGIFTKSRQNVTLVFNTGRRT